MSFGQRLRERREELGMSRAELASRLGVSVSAIGNYETGQNAVREDVLMRLFHVLDVSPNFLYQDSLSGKEFVCSGRERNLVLRFRELSSFGKGLVEQTAESLRAYEAELERAEPAEDPREIPLYRSPAAAGYAAPVFGDDYDLIPVTGEVPAGADFAVRIQGDSMEPWIRDGSVVYVNHDPLQSGDVGIFCVDGEMVCKQYVRDALGMVYLFSLNRRRADADIVLPPSSGRSLACFGRVMLPRRPDIPGR